MTHEVAFDLRGVSKRYPGVLALDSVSLTGYAGEVLALCGANGAGKSTLGRLLAGQEQPTAGTITVTGYDKHIRTPADADNAGILFMHQEPVIIDDFTVAENVCLKNLSSARSVKPWHFVSRKQSASTLSALSSVGLKHLPPGALGRALGPAARQMLALSRVQVTPHHLLILDESTASATEEYFSDVCALVEHEKAAGVSVLFISHRLPEVFKIATRIAVLRDGRLITVVDTADTSPSEITTLMIGATVDAIDPPETVDEQLAPILEVIELSSGSASCVSFAVRPGEVVGLYGLIGSGRSSIVRAISGNQTRRSGTVKVNGRVVPAKNPHQAMRHGLIYVTENRHREGLFKDFTNSQNLTFAALKKFATLGVIRRKQERDRVKELMLAFQVKGEARTLTNALSGGNQQKVCIAKWLETRPDVVLLDEPTKGIDIGARQHIYQLIRDIASEGKGVVVVTSEADEALMICNRVLVLVGGHIVREFEPNSITSDLLIRTSLEGAEAWT
ncbi:MAG: sugar ABC transporter ATP-binding protein [Acidimicrobiales bacterium]